MIKKKKYIFTFLTIIILTFTILMIFKIMRTKKLDSMLSGITFTNKVNISNEQWGLENTGQLIGEMNGIEGIDIDVQDAWTITKGNKEVIVSVIGTGVDISHKDLKDNIYINENEIPSNNIDDDNNGFIDDVSGWDFANSDATVFDTEESDAHDTLIAGVIAASSKSKGILGHVYGVAPNVTILPLKIMHNNEGGKIEDVIKAIDYAKSCGASIINFSWSTAIYSEELRKAMEKEKNILFICSAGNEGEDVFIKARYPACYKLANCISAAAIDNQGNIVDISSYGMSIDVAAPGGLIYNIMCDDTYNYVTGSSVAVAFVSGVAALIKSYNQDLSAIEIKEVIINSTITIDRLEGKVATGGYVNAFAALCNVKELDE